MPNVVIWVVIAAFVAHVVAFGTVKSAIKKVDSSVGASDPLDVGAESMRRKNSLGGCAANPASQQVASFFAKISSKAESVQSATHLYWSGECLDYADAEVIAHLIFEGALANVVELYLSYNEFGDAGADVISSAISAFRGKLASLRKVVMEPYTFTMDDNGWWVNVDEFSLVTAISRATASMLSQASRRKMQEAFMLPPSPEKMDEFWTKVDSSEDQVKDAAWLFWERKNLDNADAKHIAHLAISGSLGALKELYLGRNEIGDEGMKAFASASGSLRNLRNLVLNNNQIGDEGMKAFAAASGSLANLEALVLSFNTIGDEGMKAFAEAIDSGSLPSLQVLYVDDGQLGTEHPQLKAACEVLGIGLFVM